MFIFDCKECGGRNEVEAGKTYITCAYCGKQITLPTIKDEDRARLFNRANDFRRQGEFDKAIQLFSGIVNQEKTDPEATWGLVLAKYGIEYVEDPRTGDRIPTCNRVSNKSILVDDDYLATLDNAPDDYTRSLYKKEAERIDKIQRGILAIANREEPFDVFICYKESTGGGSRTEDSVLAQDIYDRLVKEGLRVFFARITLEDKLGQQYEPYIFAAMNSAKVMLVVATDEKNVNAVWVKNEWGRFLSLMKTDSEKVLIPCYKKMDAYDLPDALNVYQCQDMDKIGAMQDLVRGVVKICNKAQKKADYHRAAQENTAAMLDRGFICLRDADFSKADQLFEQVLNLNPHEANAYLGKLMAEREVCVDDNLAKEKELLQRSTNYHHAMEYADNTLQLRLRGYAKEVEDNLMQRLLNKLDEEYPKRTKDHETKIKEFENRKNNAINEKSRLERRLQEAGNELDAAQKKLQSSSQIEIGIAIVLILWVLIWGVSAASYGSWLYKLPNGISSIATLSIIPSIIVIIGIIISAVTGGKRRENEKIQILTPKQNTVNTVKAQIKVTEGTISAIESDLAKEEEKWGRFADKYSTLKHGIESREGDLMLIEDEMKQLLRA